MTSSGSPEAMLADILSVLESRTTGTKGRCEAYARFTRNYKENGVNLFGLDVTQNIGKVLVLVRKDVVSGVAEVGQAALEVLGVCLNDRDIVRAMTDEECVGVISLLCSCIQKTEEKTVCTRALWCFGIQNLPDNIVQKQLETILDAVDYAVQRWDGQSITMEHESVNAVARLIEQASREMTPHGVRWGKVLVPRMSHTAIKVRERALAVMESGLPLLATHRKELLAAVFPTLKSKVLPELKKLFQSKHELFVLKCWTCLVQLLGEELHHGTYINHVLPIVELGFKSTSEETKLAAFSAWQQLIDNFSTNPAVLGDTRRIKLIMQVFKINNAKQEKIALHKIKVWWHFLWLLGNKVSSNFDMVGAPLLKVCLGGMKSGEQGGGGTPRGLHNVTSPVTPRMNLTGASSQFPTFLSLQILGCEALAHFLGPLPENCLEMEHNFELDALQHTVVTGPSFFVKHSSLFISTATELFISLGKDVPESVMFHIWHWMLVHLRSAIDSPTKLDVREVLTMLLSRFQVMVLSQVLPTSVILTLFDSICKLPKKVLGSTMYSIGGGENMHGTPALFLAEVLLTPVLLRAGPALERYHTLFSSILTHGLHNTAGSLGFLQSVLQLLERNAEFVEKPEELWRLWSAVVNPLLEHIAATNEVNQGDALEHNFDSCILALTVPVTCSLSRLPLASLKTLVKTWTELYKTVNRLAAMVTNADANVVCEEVCSKILTHNKSQESMDAVTVDFQTQLCCVIVSSLDFSSMKNQSSFGLASSPTKWTRRRHRPLENIHSLVIGVAALQQGALTLAKQTEQKKPAIPLQAMFNMQVDMLCTLFTHVSASSVISDMIGRLAQPFGNLYMEASKRSCTKIFNNAFQQKLEKLWQDVCTSIQSRYTGLFDSQFLDKLSPLLEATFLHSRRQIKNLTLGLWSSTFGTVSSLEYPENLRPVLSKVREKSSIQLPGWVATSTPVIEETPVSQMSQSQAPEPRLPGMPSPHKIHGSILHRPVSPARKTSPMKPPPSPKQVTSVKKKPPSFVDFSDADFVVIKSSPWKKMVLTDHQKEVMKERRVLPAMYNSLEASMDGSLMANHFNTDTNLDGTQSETPTPTSSQPFSLFGSAIPPTADQVKNSPGKKEVIEDSSNQQKAKSKEKRGKAAASSQEEVRRSSRRRSVRFKDKETADDGNVEKELTVDDKSLEGKSESKVPLDNDPDSVVVIGDSEPMEINTQPDKIDIANDIESIDLTKDSQVDTDSGSKGTTKSSSNSETPFISPPQNFLGVLESLAASSTSKSDDTKSSAEDSAEFELTSTSSDAGKRTANNTDEFVGYKDADIHEVGIADNDVNKASEEVTDSSDVDLPSSEPLFSWKQKLNEYSQSPKPDSIFRKSFSQDDAKSPRPKSVSPHKSPRKSRRKVTNENDALGTLDKWVVKSPKKVGLSFSGNVPSNEVIVGNVLMKTLVEDTQSPTKFAQKDKNIKDINSSVLETPPKTIVDSVSVRQGNSNRKLFTSQNSNLEQLDMVEDSNIIPASPNSKSFTSLKDMGPVVKIKKLTDDDIKRYSPSKGSENEENVTPSKRNEKHGDKRKVEYCADGAEVGNKDSPHVHDDFSEFKPLENDQNDKDFFSKTLTDTEQAMLELSEQDLSTPSGMDDIDNSAPIVNIVEKNQSTNQPNTPEEAFDSSQSPNLFSQDDSESVGNICAGETLRNSESLSQPSSLSQNSESQDSAADSQGESMDTSVSQESLFDVNQNNTLQPETTWTRNTRKRKQATPKKLQPEDLKPGSKRRKEVAKKESNKPEKKVSPRIKKKMEKEAASKNERVSEVESGNKDVDNVDQSNPLAESQNSVDGEQCIVVDKTIEREKKVQKRNLRLKKDSGKDSEKDQNKTDNSPVTVETETANTDQAKSNTQNEMKDIDLSMSEKNKDEKQIEETDDEHIGQKTPEGRSNSKEPERRSTTKHKKEVAHKMALNLKRSKDVTVNDSNSNLDSNESDDDIPLIEMKLKSAESLEKKLEEQAKEDMTKRANGESAKLDDKIQGESDKAENTESNDMVITNVDESDNSDDNIPLINILTTEKSRNNKKKDKKKKQVKKIGVTSNLRSSLIKSVKLRSGEKKARISPQAKRSVDLALRRTRNKQVKKKLMDGKTVTPEERTKVEEKVNTEECDEMVSLNDLEMEVTCDKTDDVNCLSEGKDGDEVNRDEGDSAADNSTKNLIPENAVIKDSTETKVTVDSVENLNEMPKTVENSEKEMPKTVENSEKNEVESDSLSKPDSALTVESKKIDEDSADGRRSILKPSVEASSSSNMSPNRADFHPIMMARIYSPTASPSASILKKRRLSEGCLPDTDSPPAKQRRVSFAYPLEEKSSFTTNSIKTCDGAMPPSPLVTESRHGTVADKQVSKLQSSDAAANLSPTSSRPCDTPPTPGTPSQTQGTPSQTQGTPSQTYYQSSQESQLNRTDPICPELMDCDVLFDKIMPQLTTSIWFRGLDQLARARKIKTVGDLSRLTEAELDGLPIKSPKIKTVRRVLGRLGAKRPGVALTWGPARRRRDSQLKEKGQDFGRRNVGMTNTGLRKSTEDNSPDIEAILASSGSLLDGVKQLTQGISQSDNENQSYDQSSDQSEPRFSAARGGNKLSGLSVVDTLEDVLQRWEGNEMKTDQLFRVDQLLSKIHSKVVDSLKTRFHAPTSS